MVVSEIVSDPRAIKLMCSSVVVYNLYQTVNSKVSMLNMQASNGEAPSPGDHYDQSHSGDRDSSLVPTDTSKTNASISNRGAMRKHPNLHHNRHRSISCDLHNHSPPLHRKKQSSHPKHTLFAGNHSPKFHTHNNGKVAPNSTSTSQYHGKMWIRPVSIRAPPSSSMPAMVHPTSGKEHQVEHRSCNSIFTDFSVWNDTSRRRMKVSPAFDDEIMLYTSNFDQQCESPKKKRIAFGASGKPIKPRKTFVQHIVPVSES